MIRDNTSCLFHVHSRTDWLEVTVIYTGQILIKMLSARTKKISSSNGFDNGQEENEKKNNRYFFNRCLALHAIYLWLQIEIRDPSRFDNSTFSEKAFYFSLRIS